MLTAPIPISLRGDFAGLDLAATAPEHVGVADRDADGLQMGIDKATIVKLIDGLEKLSYVVRVSSETDRREKYLQITPRGRKFLDQITPEMRKLETDFLEPLSAEEKKILLGAIPKLMKPRT